MITCCNFRKFKPIIFWCILYFKNVIVDCNVEANETLYCCRSKFKNRRKAIVSYWPNLWFEKKCTHESLNHSVTNTFFWLNMNTQYYLAFRNHRTPNIIQYWENLNPSTNSIVWFNFLNIEYKILNRLHFTNLNTDLSQR